MKITQISSTIVTLPDGTSNVLVLGLGEDQKVYVWNGLSLEWNLFKNQ